MIHVEPMAADHESDYRKLLLCDSRSMVYASLEYRDFLRVIVPGTAQYLTAWREKKLVGALPLFRVDDPQLGSVLNSLPWYGSHGGCVLAPGADDTVRGALLAHYREISKAPEVLSATMVLTPEETDRINLYRQALQPATEEGRIGQITPLPDAGSDLEGRLERTFSQKTRNIVRKARKQGFELTSDDSDATWEFLHSTHTTNLAALGGRAKSRACFEALRTCLPLPMRSVRVALLGGRPVAALLLLHYNRTVEYFTPVIDHDFRPLQPLSFLIWHGMLDAISRGFRWWNWGGTWSTQVSLHHFKAGWGALDRPYTYLINTTEDSRQRMRASRRSLAERFHSYYTFPYALLEDADA